MPNGQDKIIINHGGLRSFLKIVKGYFQAIYIVLGKKRGAEKLAREIEKNNLSQEPEAKTFLEAQVKGCTEVDNACDIFIGALKAFHKGQMDRNDQMRRWIDKKLAQKTP